GQILIYQHGQYILAFEDDDDQRPQKVALLRQLLDNLYKNLQPVIQDLQSPTNSQAYNTFFFDEGNKPFLTALFKNITAGAVAYAIADPPQFWAPYSPTAAPVFWTVTGTNQLRAKQGDDEIVDAFDYCNSRNGLTAFNIFTPEDRNPFIVICPFFYDAPSDVVFGDIPPGSVDGQPASNCLQVNAKTNRFKRKVNRKSHVGYELTMYRMWILLEELAHKYYNVAMGLDASDTYNVNKASRLSPKDALGILMQYRLPKGIAGNCKSFPRLTTRRKNDIELLEVDAVDFPASVPEEDDDPPDAVITEDTVAASRVQIGATGVVMGNESVLDNGKCAPGKCYSYCVCEG
ncbi:MAG: hypothetical protein Q9223_000122, partial [Gallowayella weberi]